jgi:hypothetical protein
VSDRLQIEVNDGWYVVRSDERLAFFLRLAPSAGAFEWAASFAKERQESEPEAAEASRVRLRAPGALRKKQTGSTLGDMPLFLITFDCRGEEHGCIVRAGSEDDARRVVFGRHPIDGVEVEQLSGDGEPAVLHRYAERPAGMP